MGLVFGFWNRRSRRARSVVFSVNSRFFVLETGTALLPAVKAAHTGMAAPAPVTASDLTEMTKPELEAALTALGISFEPGRRRDTLRKMLAAAQGGAAAAAVRPAGGTAPSAAEQILRFFTHTAALSALMPASCTTPLQLASLGFRARLASAS